jgi:predicted Fe-Mo cluster-binding NifX family protein
MRDHEVGTVVAGQVCDSVSKVLDHMGVEVRTHAMGDARSAVAAVA